MRLLFSFAFILFISSVLAQETATISGIIKDFSNGEEIIGAKVFTADRKHGAISNSYGFYSLTLPKGNYDLIISFFGYDTKEIRLEITQNQTLDISLKLETKELDGVNIYGEKANDNITNTEIGVDRLSIKEIEHIPVLLGEKDVLKVLQLLPGVKGEMEGTSGFTVRGGAGDQNLILLDEATVYNAFHLLGFFSTFNSDAIKDITLYKGNHPAEFGGRLSSVVDIRMKEGNNKKFEVDGGIGLISSRLTVQGPIVKEKGSFIVSGRRTYADLIMKAVSKEMRGKHNKLYFYDLNAKANYKIGEKDKLYISGYFGRDIFTFGDEYSYLNEFNELESQNYRSGISWGNKTATLRWNRIVNSKIFSNTSLIYSDFDYKTIDEYGSNDFDRKQNLTSKIHDFQLKQDFQWFANSNHQVKFGLDATYHLSIPRKIHTSIHAKDLDLFSEYNYSLKKPSFETSLYILDDFQITPKFKINYGLRFNTFSDISNGKGTPVLNQYGELIEMEDHKKGTFIKTYFHLEPRVNMSYAFSPKTSLKLGYSRNTQNIHVLSPIVASSPIDVTIFSNSNIKPGISDQVALGWYRNFYENMFTLNVEGYYKHLQNQIDYKNSAEIFFSDNIEEQISAGIGRAYGLEILFRKNRGRFTGWLSYTLSKSERKIDDINYGNWYNTRQDRTHDLAIVGIFDINKKLSVSATFIFSTGNAVSFPVGKYYPNGPDAPIAFSFNGRNNERMPAYHRLDVGLTLRAKTTEKYESSFNFGLYNAYGRANPFIIDFETNNVGDVTPVQVTVFKFIPSITWNFKFK